MSDNIEFYKPTLRRGDMQSVLQAMVDEKIGPGSRKQEFINLLCARLKKKGGMALRSYYDALLSALIIAGVGENSNVILSIISPKIYRTAIKYLNANAIYVDIDKDSGCISSDKILDKMKDNDIDVILLYEPYSQIPYNEDYKGLNIKVIEDISQSFGSSIDENIYGNYGDIVICAFEQEHIVSCGGGAAILYNDMEYKELLKKRYNQISKYQQLPDLNAALGIVQLKDVDKHLEKRNEIFNMFKKALFKTEHKLFGQKDINFYSNGWCFPVVLESNPDDIIKFAKKYNVTCMKMFTNSIGNDYNNQYALYPNASSAILRGIAFPIYPFLKPSEIDIIMKVISHLP